MARSLKNKKTRIIGVVVANILHEFSTEVIQAIEKICVQHGFQIIVCNSNDSFVKEKEHLEVLLSKQVEGIILFPIGTNKDFYQQLYDRNYPIVFVDRYVEEIPIPAVVTDNEKAVSLAINRFLSKGYKKFALLTTYPNEGISPRKERIIGFKKILEKKIGTVEDDFIKSCSLEKIDEELMAMLEVANGEPIAFLAGNDRVLLQTLKTIKREKIRVPEEIALIGIDDVQYADIFEPSITTIKQPTFEIGEKAALILLDKIKQKKKVEQVIYRLEPNLIVRASD